MRSLVVLFAVVAVATAAPHLVAYSAVPAADVIVGPTVYAGGSAVSHQSRVDVHSSPAVVAETPVAVAPVVAEPVVDAPAVVVPAVYTAPSAVSHQSRVDVHSSPAIVAAAPAIIEGPSVYSAPVGYYGGLYW